MLTPEQKAEIRDIALRNGFKLKEQPDGSVDLNPYVYEFTAEIQQKCITNRIGGVVDSLAATYAYSPIRLAALDEAIAVLDIKADELDQQSREMTVYDFNQALGVRRAAEFLRAMKEKK